MEQPERPERPAPTVVRVVSGGQSGVDRAALDAAAELGVPRGGWCPAGGWAEDLVEPPGVLALHPSLVPSPDRDPASRTRLNVRDSDAVLVLTGGVDSPGTGLTVSTARALDRPVLVDPPDAARAAAWLRDRGSGLVLDVAGPRASEWPEAHDVALRFLRELLVDVAGDDDGRHPER